MAALRAFGRAKRSTEQSICEESRHLQEAMEKEKGRQKDTQRKDTDAQCTQTEGIPSVQVSRLTLCPP